MGRQLRRVPKGWQHPKDKHGNYHPFHALYYGDAVEAWIQEHQLWLIGQHPDQLQFPSAKKYKFFEMWTDKIPSCYAFNFEKWTPEIATSFQMYETVSEGTPVSPVLNSIDELRVWLLANGWAEGNLTDVIMEPDRMIFEYF